MGPEAEQFNVGIEADPTATTNFVNYCRMRRSQFTNLANPATGELADHDEQAVDYESAKLLDLGDEGHLAYPVWILDAPQCETTIEAIGGEPYYPDPNAVINDSKQMVKFFGEFVWNYFRQQLRENSRTEHHREPQEIVGRADEIIVDELVALCAKHKIDCSFCAETQPENGWFHIQVNGLQTPPEFSGELIMLLAKAKSYDINVVINDLDIRVRENVSAPMISTFIVKPEHVMVLDNSISVTDDSDDGAFTINQVSFRTIGAQRMDQEDHVLTIERTDVVRAIRNALPEGDCRRILELLQQNGTTYDAFRAHQGGLFDYDGIPRQQHMAQFLNITPRAVKNHVTTIRHVCHIQGFSPINYR
jgi:DNA-binding NarL/FixJ family response regulator